ncbi:hypothetical protein KAH55_05775 [bacterium]|nr:hypothetical protein [bacterium]
MKQYFLLATGLFLVFGLSCNGEMLIQGPQSWIQVAEFKVVEFPYANLIYTGTTIAPRNPTYPQDTEGIPLFEYNGERYYHPLTIAQRMFHDLDSYAQTQDVFYLNRVKRFSQKLEALAIRPDDIPFYPLPFDFALHGDAEYTEKAPWYSGIAHGRILSMYARIYMITGEQKYRDLADQVFRSMVVLADGTERPWVACLDDDGYFWVEEYPWDPLTEVLNGFMVAVFAFYDYFLITHSPVSEFYLNASLTTLKHYVADYRNPGEPSAYCLLHRVQSVGYHLMHIDFLKYTYQITEDPYFSAMADSFYADYHE